MDFEPIIAFIGFSFFTLLGFIFFCIYYFFKQMQFVIQAINLYKDMVVRQDAMLKILKDIRDINSGGKILFSEDVKVTSTFEASKSGQDFQKEKIDAQNAQKAYDNGNCPECGAEIEKNQDRCVECDLFLIEWMK
jgi:hypothetical protein